MKYETRMLGCALIAVLLTAPFAVAREGDGSQSAPNSRGCTQPRTQPAPDSGSSLSQTERDKLYRRIDQSSKRAIKSMCVECMGERYNRPGPKTPLTLPDELSQMTGEPQLETEP